MISGGQLKAEARCDWPGCKSSLDLTRVESQAPAIDILARMLPGYGWMILESGKVVCDEPKHREQAISAWLAWPMDDWSGQVGQQDKDQDQQH